MSSFTDIVQDVTQGSDSAVTKLWKKCGVELIEKAQKVVAQFGIGSTEPEEIANSVFAQCVMWSQESTSPFENRRKFWALLSLATFLHGRRIQKHDGVEKRIPIWDSGEFLDLADRDDDYEQYELWDEYEQLLRVHPEAKLILPMLMDRQPIDVIAKRLESSVRSTYRLVAELRKELAKRLYE